MHPPKKTENPIFRFQRDHVFSTETVSFITRTRSTAENVFIFQKTLRIFFFELAHDRQSHEVFHKIYDKIVTSMYMRKFNRHLQQYIAHCPDCQLNQTKKHSTYKNLRPIKTPTIFFHIINIDFIFGLFLNASGLNYAISITCKFNNFFINARQKHVGYNGLDEFF